MIVNGLCESCLAAIGDALPPILRIDLPESEDIQLFRNLIARVMRQGLTAKAINALRRLVDQPVGSITGGR